MGIMTSLRGIMKPSASVSSSSNSSCKSKQSCQVHVACQIETAQSSSNLSVLSTQKPSYRFEHGRRYHNIEDSVYVLPNDDPEIDRLHQQHWVLHHAFDGNFSSPVHKLLEEGADVLDSCCGPATWTLDMAKVYDRSEFYGIDISSVFPEDIKPANTHFQLANITNRLPFPDNHFDFIHQRLLIFALTRSDWTKALDELIRVLKPGGWIEFKELELNLENAGVMTTKLKESMITMTTTRDMNPTIGRELRLLLIQRGLLNIQAKRISVPVNHGGKIGELFWDNYKQLSLALGPVISSAPPIDFEQFVNSCAQECAKEKTNWGWHVVYAQKPLSPIRFTH